MDKIPAPDTFFTHEHSRLPEGLNMIRSTLCPRCGGGIPNNETPGAYPGALSRTDNLTEICSACGFAEGMEDFREGGHKPKSTWLSASRPVDGDTQRSE